MIELSKCPTCASEDKVTIAGKEFCMRCGTPSPDATNVPANNGTDNSQPASSGVSKFATSPANQSQNVVPSAPNPNAVDPSIAQVAPATPVATVNATPDTTPASFAPAVDISTAVSQPAPEVVGQIPQPNPVIQPVAPIDQTQPAPQVPMANAAVESISNTDTQLAQAPQPQAQPQAQPEMNSLTPATNEPINQTLSQPAAPPQPPAMNPIAQPTPEAIPTATPAPIQIPTDQPLTLPSETPEPQEQMAPQINTHSMPMNLETHDDSGVFSDAQLDALSKSTAAPIDLERPGNSHDDSPGSTPPHALHHDIKPVSNTNTQPSESTQSAVSKVAENDAKVPDKKTKSKKVLKPAGIALSIVALFLVGAYIWQVNYPTLAFKIASTKAGMSASMPGYMPGGYKLAGEIQTNPGAVTYNLVNDAQGKKIAISQTKTDWDSQALAENYVAPKAENYLALQAQGLTIYMLGDTQATWVNKGTWYKIESADQSLSQDQAIKIATSL